MAIDTAEKRRSASAVGHRIGGRGITPNVLKPVAWRQQAGWGYSGIPAGAAAVSDPFTDTPGTWALPEVAGTWASPTSAGSWADPAVAGSWEDF